VPLALISSPDLRARLAIALRLAKLTRLGGFFEMTGDLFIETAHLVHRELDAPLEIGNRRDIKRQLALLARYIFAICGSSAGLM
jgi:hypothetical protein